MGLTGCYALLKYLVILVNLIFWLAGLAVIVLSVWMLTDPTFYVSMAQDEASYYTGLYIFLAAGTLMFIVGFLGCCGALRESPCMLVSFFCFLMIIAVAEIAAGAWAYSNRDLLENYVRDTVKITVQKEYGVVDSRTKTFDSIQQGLQCCGVNGPSDWANSKYNQKDDQKERTIIEMAVSSVMQTYRIPPTCCHESFSEEVCNAAVKLHIGAVAPDKIYNEGCVDKLIEWLKSHMSIVLGVGIGIAIIECLGMIFSLILCCGIRNMDRYKA